MSFAVCNNPSYVWTIGNQKIHFGYEVKVWKDPWIPAIPARPAHPSTLVFHPNMRVSDLINQVSKEWDVGLLEDYVVPVDRPLIRSLAISSILRCDTFCRNYTNNGQSQLNLDTK